MRDHPVIELMEQTGYPDGREPAYPVCPVCGREADTFYEDSDGNIVGCDECIKKVDAWEIGA